jgi:outer membrane protein
VNHFDAKLAPALARLVPTFALALLLGASALPAAAQTLGEAAKLALESNPSVRAQREQLSISREGYIQARSALLPNINGQVSVNTDRPKPAPFGYPVNQSEVGVGLTQQLYAGGRTVAGMRAAKAQIEASREQVNDSEQNLLQDVISAYTQVMLSERSVVIYGKNVDALRNYLERVSAQRAAGDITQTDVAQAQTQLAAAEGTLAQVRASLEAARASYQAIIGEPAGTLAVPPPLDPLLPPSIDAAAAAADAGNPRVRQAVQAELAARAQVSQARGARLPTVTLTASHAATDTAPFDKGPQFLGSDRTTNAAITATVPLFAGGYINSRIRQAERSDAIAADDVENARRDARRQVLSAWGQVDAARIRLRQGEAQITAAQLAVRGMNEEYGAGTRSTYEVLNAEQELRNAEISLETARRDAYLANADLLAAAGRLSPDVLSGTVVQK